MTTSKPEKTEQQLVDNFISTVAQATLGVLQDGEKQLGKKFQKVAYEGKLDDGRVFTMSLGVSNE